MSSHNILQCSWMLISIILPLFLLTFLLMTSELISKMEELLHLAVVVYEYGRRLEKKVK